MDTQKLQEILKLHRKWLNHEEGGQRANLYGANLYGANLCGANLYGADLRSANLCGADLDLSCWPLWCGSKGVKIDKGLYTQLLAHICAVEVDDEDCKASQKMNLELAKQSHRAGDLGLIPEVK